MESQDQRNAVSRLVAILKHVTRIVQLVPFVYLCFYALYLLLSCFAGEGLLTFLDNILTVQPLTILSFLIASKIFNLCIWHKIACLLPSSTQIESYIDNFIITFTQEEVLIINMSIFSIIVIFLILSFRRFLNYGR